MAITAGGVGSGLDINGIVSQLMLLERQPINRLEAKKTEYNTQLSAYGRLSSAVSSFETAMEGLGSLDKFKVFTTSSSDETVLTASADSSAAAGLYSIDVTRLAQNHKMGSNEIDKADVFSGNLEITVDGTLLTIDTTGKTLAEIRDAINNDSGNPGVTASIFNTGGDNQRLVLTSEESGQAQAITINEAGVSNTTTPASTLSLATINRDADDNLITTAELDATFSVDGYNLTSSSNSVSDVIDGLTLQFKDLGTSTLQLSRDSSQIEENVKSFVDEYNKLQSTLTELEAGDLNGDTTLWTIRSQIRNVLNTAASGLNGSYSSLAELGILSDAKTGELSVDSTRLTEVLDTDFQSVADVFANDDQGYAFRFAELAETLLDDDMFIDARKDTLNTRIDNADDQIAEYERRMELKEAALRSQFASLDSLISNLQSSSTYLAGFA